MSINYLNALEFRNQGRWLKIDPNTFNIKNGVQEKGKLRKLDYREYDTLFEYRRILLDEEGFILWHTIDRRLGPEFVDVFGERAETPYKRVDYYQIRNGSLELIYKDLASEILSQKAEEYINKNRSLPPNTKIENIGETVCHLSFMDFDLYVRKNFLKYPITEFVMKEETTEDLISRLSEVFDDK